MTSSALKFRKATADLEFLRDLPVPTNPSAEACRKTALNWLKTCMGEHDSCAASTVTPILPTRIIDVGAGETTAPVLILPPSNTVAPFVALSHCWGGRADMAKLTTKNVSSYQEGIDIQSLSLNFRDAITITRWLGIRYLWIDAVCILQDSAADWIAESPKMTNIYGSATLVLSATGAKHCDEGILRPRYMAGSPPLGPLKNFFFTECDQDIEQTIAKQPLSSRGWALQERMVAQRILHYTPEQMYWECNTHLCAELPWMSAMKPKKLTSKLIAHRYHKLRRSPDLAAATDGESQSEATEPLNADNILSGWLHCIQLYSIRELTFSSDKLPAVAGLAAIFQDTLPGAGQYLAGIWSGYTTRCLRWWRSRPAQDSPSTRGNASFRAPSWSWARHDGEIKHPRTWDTEPGHTPLLGGALDARLVDHQIIPIEGDAPSHFMGARDGSYVVLEAMCLQPFHLRGLAGHWYEDLPARVDVSSKHPCAQTVPEPPADYKFLQLEAISVDGSDRVLDDDSPKVKFWGLYLHRNGPDSEFQRIGLLKCSAKQAEYSSLPWERERVKIV